MLAFAEGYVPTCGFDQGRLDVYGDKITEWGLSEAKDISITAPHGYRELPVSRKLHMGLR